MPGDLEKLLPLAQPGGLVVLDDYTPGGGEDVSRQIWLDNPAYRALEVTVTSSASAILAIKR